MLPRTFKVSLLISMLIHMGVFVVLSNENVAERIKVRPVTVAKQKDKPTSVRFELIETPAAAKTDQAPTKTTLLSDKNTQAQDRFESEKKLKDAPHMEGKHEDVKDTRPKMIAAKPPVPATETAPAPQKPQQKPEQAKAEEKPVQEPEKESPSGLPAEKEEEPGKPDEEIRIEPEPEPKEEIKELAKKLPDSAEPVMPAPSVAPSRMMSAASAGNTGVDAKITGELSFAASRHFFGEYLVTMKQAVEREWVSRLVSKYSGFRSSRAVIDFKIQPDGQVSDLTINSYEGDQYFAVMCVSSINDAQPFGEIPYAEAQGLPEEFVNKPLNIQFVFRYN